MKTRNLTFHADPAHGWLEVSLEDIHDFGIGDKISRYSYIKGDRVFLEEDCDAGVYLEKAKEEGWDISVTEKHTNHDSFIRNLASFSLAWEHDSKKEFIVRKLVEYQYTIQADNCEEAEEIASNLDCGDNDQMTTLDISAESLEEYKNSLGVSA